MTSDLSNSFFSRFSTNYDVFVQDTDTAHEQYVMFVKLIFPFFENQRISYTVYTFPTGSFLVKWKLILTEIGTFLICVALERLCLCF